MSLPEQSERLFAVNRARCRLDEVLRRHVRAEDNDLSDNDLVFAVTKRYLAERRLPLIDPAE